ncbi:MAG: DUF4215 domain-containing protein [bacterium]
MKRNNRFSSVWLVIAACGALAAAGCGDDGASGADCGNGVLEGDEECDDGNNLNGDGCTGFCLLEGGPVCGNGIIEGTEACDDGNSTPGDGCAADCTLEVAPGCGNGVVEVNEECDDGNLTACDGCSATCDTEACGNGLTECDEECDDGNAVNGDGCSSLCVTEVVLCGNGTVDAGEECDDGNTTDGDGCAADCTLEVAPGCGNGVLEAGEDCDDGDTVDCDGCSATCAFEVCGNNITECAEECDDGNTTNGDGCAADCTLESVCGDGTQEGLEECDDGNLTDCDGCSASCTIEVCGNGTRECAEQCDDGNTTDGDGCQGNCMNPVCGDGIVDTGETCDDGNTSNTDACLNTCVPASCGDGYVQATVEDCDGNGAGTPGETATCDSDCTTAVCGDGTVNTTAGEACDDGNATDCDGCRNNCTVPACGNGVVECAEECDDGNLTSGDGCDSSCATEGPVCTQDFELTCGDTDSWNNNGTGSTDVIDSYPCEPTWTESGPEYAYWFTAPGSGDVTLALSNMTADLDVFVISDSGGTCMPASCTDSGDDGLTFTATAGETYYIVVDGYQGAISNYTLDLTCDTAITCGDGAVDAGEQCDDSNTTACDGCSATCQLEVCGNNVTECGEQCDDGNTTSGDGCQANCLLPVCGDGIVDPGEECDDGGTTPGDGCDATCHAEVPTCTAGWSLSCGGSDFWNNGGAGSTDVFDSYSCGGWDESGPEYAYTFVANQSAAVTVDLSGMTGDLDVYVLSNTGGMCDANNCLAYGDNQATFTATAGQSYFIVVDGYQGAVSDYTIDLTCVGTAQPGDEGQPCTQDTDCNEGHCRDEANDGYPGGFCAQDCIFTTCADAATECFAFAGGAEYCIVNCATQADCRPGYGCWDIGTNGNICLPDCDADGQCTDTGACNEYFGYCAMDFGRAVDGSPCTADGDCESGYCIDQVNNPSWTGGYCSSFCTLPLDNCPGDGSCEAIFGLTLLGGCLDGCTGDSDCRQADGYTCQGGVCRP